jgi:methionyl-tRNA synthetase
MNKYIDERAPWTLAKAANTGDTEAADNLAITLYSCLEAVRVSAILLQPFMPVASQRIYSQLGLPVSNAPFPVSELDASGKVPGNLGITWGGLPAGTQVNAPLPLFPRLQELTVDDATLYALGSSHTVANESKETTQPLSEPQTPAPGTPVAPPAPAPEAEALITIDDFMKVQLKVAEVLAAEPVPNATKLLRLTVQAGEDDTRTILAGIAEYYQPDELIGKQVVIVANLQPRKMRGIESQGMLLAADQDGRAILLHPGQEVPVGSRVR